MCALTYIAILVVTTIPPTTANISPVITTTATTSLVTTSIATTPEPTDGMYIASDSIYN